MKLWLLLRTDRADWDEYQGFVIRAETEDRAREIAQVKEGEYQEPKFKHFDGPFATTICVEIGQEGPEGIVLKDFHAG